MTINRAGGSREQVFKNSRVGSGRVGSGRVGSGQEVFETPADRAVGSREFSNLTDRVGAERPDPSHVRFGSG